MLHRLRLSLLPLLTAIACSCAGGSAAPAARTPPNLPAFLRLPVATPSSCPSGVSGSTSGRRSPWVGHVDISVFRTDHASPGQGRTLAATLRSFDQVQTVYAESRGQAHAEFARLYTCSAQVPRSAVRASYRLVLRAGVTQPERDALVRTIAALPGVADVSCDPSDPCVGVAGTPNGSER